MWSRRSLLIGAGLPLLSIGVVGKLQSDRSDRSDRYDRARRYVRGVDVDEVPIDVDDDDRAERLVRVRFVPVRRLVAVRLEGRADEASDGELARALDHDDDGWYAITRRTRLGREESGRVQFFRAPQSRRAPDYDERWIVEGRGYRPGSAATVDFRGFEVGASLRVVVVPHVADPFVAAEHVVGADPPGR